MRPCPFCSAENADELAVCQSCGRRLPPLPPRRPGNKGPPTGIVLPPRPPATTPPPRKPPSVPPANVAVVPAPAMAPPVEIYTPTPAPLPPPPAAPAPTPAPQPEARQSLLDALAPSPAAERRPPPPVEARSSVEPARRQSDSQAPVPQAPARPNVRPLTRETDGLDSLIRSMPAPSPNADTVPSASAYPSTLPNTLPNMPVGMPAAGEPPPTRVFRSDLGDRPFTPPKVVPIPEIPEPGLIHAARYAYYFWRARWQRRGAIRQLGADIKQDTDALDQVLGGLGRAARGAGVEGRVFSAENSAITAAEQRIAALQHEHTDVEARKADENSKYVDVERERNEKLAEAERLVDEVQRELTQLEGERRKMRDDRKTLERRWRAYLKAGEDHDRQAGAAQMGDQLQELRQAAEGHRREAAAHEPERQELDRRLAGLERPIGEATAKLDAAKAELDAARRSLNDAREGHTHRLAELDAEQKRKQREISLAESEIQRRLVTLGTLVNLNRIEDRSFAELYERIDRLRGAITSRTTEIEKLTAEREAFDRGTLVRGVVTIGGAFVLLIALIVIFRAIL
jgi:hypothetical protein